jgi:16S rRNA (uracil1498-N3)-methyltransferase
MRLHRFYVTQPLGEEIVVDDVSIVKQWLRVFRYKQGDSVTLFDGHFIDYTYSIASISGNLITLKLSSTRRLEKPDKEVILFLSLIKKDNVELVAQKATELGVSRIIPIIAEHSEKKGLNKERLKTILIEASEQCGRGDIPFIDEPVSYKEAISGVDTSILHIVGDIQGKSVSEEEATIKTTKSIAIWVGPEGGWGEKELELFKNKGFLILSFGKTVLRAETAAIAMLSYILFR